MNGDELLDLDYRALLARITQTANLFHRLGATKDTVIALALPNLPETHFAIWGAEAAGIVLPLNPLLEAAALGALLEASGAEILVTLAPHPGTDLWTRLQQALARHTSLKHVVLPLACRTRCPDTSPSTTSARPSRARTRRC